MADKSLGCPKQARRLQPAWLWKYAYRLEQFADEPPGRPFARPIFPALRVNTRSISWLSCGSGVNIAPEVDVTRQSSLGKGSRLLVAANFELLRSLRPESALR